MSIEPKKDSGSLSTEIVKQFLSLAVGGIAFVTGLVFAGKAQISLSNLVVIFICFGISAIGGFLFLMNRVSLISEDSDYDPYSGLPRVFSIIQIATFCIGVFWLAFITVRELKGAEGPDKSNATIELHCGNNVIKQHLPAEGNIIFAVDDTSYLCIDLEIKNIDISNY